MKVPILLLKKLMSGQALFFLAAVVAMALAIAFGLTHPVNYSLKERGNLLYCSARVDKVTTEEITFSDEGIARGVQDFIAVPTEGRHKGKALEVHSVLNLEHSIYLKEGQRFILCIDESESGALLTSVYGYQRSGVIALVVVLFLLVLVLTCGKKGLRSAFGLIFGFVMLLFLTIPLISLGMQPLLATLLTLLPVMAVSLISLLGFSRGALTALLSTFLGIVFAALLFWVIGGALHVSGYNLDDIETLVVVAQMHPVHIRDLLFAGVIISCLGAIMDVAVSIVSSVEEIYGADPAASRGKLFRAGLRVGRDIAGSTASTLILAFAGTFFVTLFLFHIYDIGFIQLINMDDIAIEIAQAMSGTIALTLAAPLTAFLASRLCGGQRRGRTADTTHRRIRS